MEVRKDFVDSEGNEFKEGFYRHSDGYLVYLGKEGFREGTGPLQTHGE